VAVQETLQKAALPKSKDKGKAGTTGASSTSAA